MYLFRTFKKSTAPYKVHNMGLRYIKVLTYPEAADNPPCLVKGQSHHHPTMKIIFVKLAVMGIRRIRMFLDLPDPEPDPLVRGTDPDPDPSLLS
jgi:hypothetical protein